MPRDGWVAASFTKIVEMKLDFIFLSNDDTYSVLLPTINRPPIIYIGALGRLGTAIQYRYTGTVMVFFSHSRSQD